MLQAIFTALAGICSHTAAFNTMHRIKVRVLEHMSKFNLGYFQEHALGQIKTTLFDDVDRIENFLAHSTLEMAQAVVVPLMMFLFMLRLNWKMALIMLIPKNGSYGIDFDHVTFRYTKEGEEVLSDIDLHLKAGSVNAFVGPSGAGKTTAAQLIGRYWDADRGTIKIGGVPVNELKAENLSDLTAFVFQDVFLMEDTLLENIRMGTNATEEQVRQAAKAAQIDDFIMSLPNGYLTQIGDEGVKLSGGQKQRVSIARAILKDAPIVVFDEATSYSDIENEHKIQLALQNLLQGKTTIMIAHRLHTIRNADHIMVFEDGKAVEQGTHDELVAREGRYSHMWDTYIREMVGKE